MKQDIIMSIAATRRHFAKNRDSCTYFNYFKQLSQEMRDRGLVVAADKLDAELKRRVRMTA